jgi:hypothetical protein
MQSAPTTQDVEAGAAPARNVSTSTPQMLALVVISTVACVFQGLALFGWYTVEVDAGPVQVRFISLDPPITQIVFFGALFAFPTAIATPLCMLTHWKPDMVLLGSKQFTDTLRGQFAAPFRMKYLYFIMAAINGLSLISYFKYEVFLWPLALNISNVALYSIGLVFVFLHFNNPNVPAEFQTVAASVMGGAGSMGHMDAKRIDQLENDLKALRDEVQVLRQQMVKQTSC